MNKKIFTLAILSLSIAGFCALPVQAEEITTAPIDADAIDAGTTETPTPETPSRPSQTTSGDTPTTPSENTTDDASDTLTTEPITNCAPDDLTCIDENTVIHEGTAGEPEVVCADPTEPGCEDPEIAAAEDPELWPLIVSLAALGITLVVILALNLFRRKKS